MKSEDLIPLMTRIANLDFTVEAPEKNDSDELNYFATGINLLNYHLKQHFDRLKKVEVVFNAIDLPIVGINSDHKITVVNRTFVSLSGFDEFRLKQRSFISLFELGGDPIELIRENRETLPVKLHPIPFQPDLGDIDRIYRIEKLNSNYRKKKTWSANKAYEKAFEEFALKIRSIREREGLRTHEKETFLNQMRSSLDKLDKQKLRMIESIWLEELNRILD